MRRGRERSGMRGGIGRGRKRGRGRGRRGRRLFVGRHLNFFHRKRGTRERRGRKRGRGPAGGRRGLAHAGHACARFCVGGRKVGRRGRREVGRG